MDDSRAAAYVAAWDHIRAIFTAVGATNVSWVWCPTGIGFEDGRAKPYYPGDNEVDWVCADVYSSPPPMAQRGCAPSWPGRLTTTNLS